jgi:sterol desaturase/sphingolipid hydroxylase (fatty acid hydroxylase superfamily)
MKLILEKIITYALYPLLLAITVGLFAHSVAHGWNLSTVFAWMAGSRILVLLAAEYYFPAKPEWKMTWLSFQRDLKYMVINGSVAGLLKLLTVWLALDISKFNTGLVANTSIWQEILALIVVFEFFQYWFHRLCHEGTGRFGAWLWKVHLPHHLPDKVYLLMHPAGHPINLLVTLAIINFPMVVLGARPESIFLYNALIGLQGLVSHVNVKIKAGPLNYLLVGTELHRYHHSADVNEAKNFGVLTPIWDIVFGTFQYQPERLPHKLGVENPSTYPSSEEVLKLLVLPFKRD